jgi:antitoxin (DNA-binding transcriptional repressor) of toxin-antitoxin stability system
MKTMPMREFLRGGYKNITELTLITNHGKPVATWMPQTHGKKREFADMRAVSSVTSPHPESRE